MFPFKDDKFCAALSNFIMDIGSQTVLRKDLYGKQWLESEEKNTRALHKQLSCLDPVCIYTSTYCILKGSK